MQWSIVVSLLRYVDIDVVWDSKLSTLCGSLYREGGIDDRSEQHHIFVLLVKLYSNSLLRSGEYAKPMSTA